LGLKPPNSNIWLRHCSYHGHCIMTFTGWMLLTVFSFEWLQPCIPWSVCTAWLQRTWLNCVCLSHRQQVVVVSFGPQQPATWSYTVSCCRLSTYGTRAFSVDGPVCRNALLDYLKSSDLSFNCFRQRLKTFYLVNIDTCPSTTSRH